MRTTDRNVRTAAMTATGIDDERPGDASSSAQRQALRPMRDRGRDGANPHDTDTDVAQDDDA